MRDTDYSNTIFYKICCKTPEITDVYIGHTTNFVMRKYGHEKSCINEKNNGYNLKVYSFIRQHGGWDNWKMEIIGFKCCNNLREACQEEQKYYDEYNATLNSIQPAKHIVTPILLTERVEDVHNDNKSYKFICKTCDFKCNKLSNYNLHLSTMKHKKLTHQILTEKISKNVNSINNNKLLSYICECGKSYSARNSLWYHKKKCTYETTAIDDKTEDVKPALMDLLLKQQEKQQEENNELKKMLLQRQEQHQQQMKEQQEQNNKQIQEIVDRIQRATAINN